jgi:twinkle protein
VNPDKLILNQCGFENVLSVPSGSNDLDWVEHCWEYLERFSEIVIWVDNDNAGKELQNKLIAKFDDWKLRTVKSDCKDANELFLKHGCDAVVKAIRKAETVKKSNITDISHIKRNRNRTKYPTVFETLDKKLGGFYGGQLIVWTGYNGGGKSTFISHILINLVESNHKVFAYSGELPREDFKEIIDFQVTGKKNLSSEWCDVKGQNLPSLKPENDDRLDNWYRGMMFLFDTENYATEIEMIKAMEYMAKRENVKTFLVDNMLTTIIEGRESELEKQTKFINTLKRFARKHDAVVHLVAHPRKPEKGQTKVDKYSISGTANISNLADRVLAVHRLREKDYEEDPSLTGYSSIVMVFKDRKFGAIDFQMPLHYDFYSKRFFENESQLNYEYSWNKPLF